MEFAGLLRAVTVAIEDLLPAGALADRLGGREDALQVERAVAGRLGRVIDNYLAEVSCGPQRAGGQLPDLDEVGEVAELIQASQPFDRVSRKGHAVAAGDLQQSPCPDGALQMHMQLDLRESHGSDYRVAVLTLIRLAVARSSRISSRTAVDEAVARVVTETILRTGVRRRGW
jgi:hypothetical protein